MEIVGLLVMTVLILICTFAGIGSAGLILGILITFFGFGVHSVVGLVHFANFLGCAARVYYSKNKKNPSNSGKSLIDYEFAMIVMPSTMIGTAIGVILNKFMSEVLIVFILFAFLLFTSRKIWKQANKISI